MAASQAWLLGPMSQAIQRCQKGYLQLLGKRLALAGGGVQGVSQEALHIQKGLVPLGCEGLTGPAAGQALQQPSVANVSHRLLRNPRRNCLSWP